MELQRTDQWFKDRLGRFTASKIQLLEAVGKSGKMTQGLETYIYNCVKEEITQEWSEFDVKAMKWGRTHEPRAIALFELLYNKTVFEMPFIPYGDHSGGSPDGGIKGEPAVIEVKCPFNSSYHLKYLGIRSPEDLYKIEKDYYCQLQWNMHVTGSEWGYFISYDPRILENPMLVMRMPKDDECIARIERGLEIAIEYKETIYDVLQDNTPVLEPAFMQGSPSTDDGLSSFN